PRGAFPVEPGAEPEAREGPHPGDPRQGQQRAERHQRQADGLREGSRQEAGRLSQRVLAPAKINLWLNVLGRRADGYHLIDSLVAFTNLADEIDAVPSDRLSLAVDGPLAGLLAEEGDNLVLRAARLLADYAGIAPRAALRLTKHIPVAAGLGGGSADAAA